MDEYARQQIEDALAELYDVLDLLYDDDGDNPNIPDVERTIEQLEGLLIITGDDDDDESANPYGFEFAPLSDDILSSMRGQVFTSPDEAAEYLRDIPTGGKIVYWYDNLYVYYAVAVYNSDGDLEGG